MRSLAQSDAVSTATAPLHRRLYPDANRVLLYGLAAWLCCGLLGPVAWIKGSAARKGLKEFPDRYSGKVRIIIGMWLGILVTLGLIFGIVVAALDTFEVIDFDQ